MTTFVASPATPRVWNDSNTGRQVTQVGLGLNIGYFRRTKHLPDGRILARGGNSAGRPSLFAIDAETLDIEEVKIPCVKYLRVRPTDGRTWYFSQQNRGELWEVVLPYGTPRLICTLPEHMPGVPADITCDGNTLIYEEHINDAGAFPIPTGFEAGPLWRYINRRRRGAIYAYDIPAQRIGRLVEMAHVSPAHSDPSPTDPTLLRFTEDVLECAGQRMFSIRTDGSEPRVLRAQEYGEMITHEFWWADPNYIGYTYMDRRGDETVLTLPWCEYAPRPTRLGICDLAGNEVYLSDPLNSYHAHLYMSPDGSIVCGEGTAYNNFICAARFSMKETRLDLKPLATIRTPWVPTRGSHTNCAFSVDGKWLLYNDTVGDGYQVCRVRVDV